jgi:DNA-binding CsgD family transcriptional regulator
MAQAVTPHQVTALIARCYAGLDASRLRQEVLRRLRQMMSVDAAFFATVDPETLLFTSAVADGPLRAATPLFLGNEFGREDVNKFARLAEAADPVSSLDRATQGSRPQSARYREIMSPLGLGDELRAALLAGKSCWGVLCLHREDATHGFAPGDLDLVRRISPHLAEGLRRAATLPAAAATTPAAGIAGPATPGMIVLDSRLAVVSMNPEAGQWLAEIDDPAWADQGEQGAGELPMAVYAAAAGLIRLETGPAPPSAATVQLRSRAGRWLSLHASRLHGPPEPQIGVVVAPAPAAQAGSVLLRAHGLTGAQSRVVALVIKGQSTRQIVQQLHISANTVQEHLTRAFDKFGVRSRRELVAAVLSGPPAAPGPGSNRPQSPGRAG